MSTALCYLHPDCRASAALGAECLRSRRSDAARWREQWLPAMRTARWLERKALETGLPFEVRPDWYPPSIDWAEFGQDLTQFEERVRLATEKLGAPSEVTTSSSAWGDNAPDLIATWKIAPPPWERRSHLEVKVRVLQPTGVRPARGTKRPDLKFEPIKLRSTDSKMLARIAKSVGVPPIGTDTDTKGQGK